MEKIIKKVNGKYFKLVKNPYYKRNNLECKYKVMYFSKYHNSYIVLLNICSKKEFTKKNIISHFHLVLD